jgi:hypothetical protein
MTAPALSTEATLTPQQKLEQMVAQIQDRIAFHESNSWDEDYVVRQIHRNPDQDLFVLYSDPEGPPEPLVLRNHAECQLLRRLQLPVGYLHRPCPHWLQAENFNYWAQLRGNVTTKLRFYKTLVPGEKFVRAVVSSRYKPDLDDINVFPVILSALQDLQKEPGDLVIERFTPWDLITQLSVNYSSLQTSDRGFLFKAGVTVINSEVGAAALWIRPSIHDYGPENYLFLDRYQEGATCIRHTSGLSEERLRGAVAKAKKTAQVGIARLLQTEHEMVDDPAEEVRKIVKQSDYLGMWVATSLENELSSMKRISKLELARTILKTVQHLPAFEAYKASSEVGRYLSLFQDTEQRIKDLFGGRI